MTGSLHPEHQDLLQFLYQFPIGLIAMDERGVVSTMNPAASRILTPEVLGQENVSQPLPILQRLVPELMGAVATDPTEVGVIGEESGQAVDGREGTSRFSVTVHRLRTDQIVVSLTDVTEERRIVNEQRARAQRLQRALLGSADQTALDLSVGYLPAHREDFSGGDWYDVIRLDEGRVALVVGDVVGHDIEASATMGQLRAIVRAFALDDDDDPISVLERTDSIAQSIDNATGATLHYAVLDDDASSVTYASAGHPPPLLIRNDGTTELLTGGRRPVLAATRSALRPPTPGESATTKSASAHISTGDILVMYTDGLIERRDETLDAGFARLVAEANILRGTQSIDEFVDRLTLAMLDDSNHRDDVCVLAIRYEPTR